MKKVLTLIVAIMLLFTTTVCIPVLAEDKGDPTLVLSDGSFQKSYTHTKLQLKNAPGDNYEYKFIVYNSTSKQWYKIHDYSDSTEIDWYTGPAGHKSLYVDIRNKELYEDYRRISLPNVYVTDKGLSVSKFISSEGNELDEKSYTILTADADKGNTPYEYKFIVHNERTGQWYKIQDYSTNNTAKWYTSAADQKTLYVDVKDADGFVVRQELSVVVESDNIVLKANYEKVLEGEEASITFEASGRRNQTVELFVDGSSIGIMHDDGLNGDITENDGTYSLTTTIIASVNNTPQYYAKAKKESNRVVITTYRDSDLEHNNELVDSVISDINDIEAEINNKSEPDDAELSLDKATELFSRITDYSNDLKERGVVNEVSVDGLTFSFEFPLETYLYTIEFDPNFLGGDSNINQNYITTFENDNMQFNSSIWDQTAEKIQDKTNSYVVKKEYDGVTTINGDELITMDSLRSLSDNRIVIWIGHGAYTKDLHSVIKTQILVDEIDNTEYKNDLVNNSLVECDGGTVGLTAKFFETYYRNKKFNDTLFYLGTCAGAYDSVLVDKLCDLGVRTVLAYDNIVNYNYNEHMFKDIFNTLVAHQLFDKNSTYSVSFALNIANQSNGFHDPYLIVPQFNILVTIESILKQDDAIFKPARLRIFGDKDYRLSDYDYSYDDDSLFDYELYSVYDPYEDKTLTGISIRSYNGNDTSVRIPKEIDGYAVYGIGSEAFLGKDILETVYIPNSVRTIGESAFENCNNLKSVNIPNRLLRLDSNAFFHCNQLQQVKFPDTLTTIGNSAFNGCTALDEIVLPSKIEELGDSCFKGTSISSVFIPKTIKKARFAFSETNSIITFSIEKGLDTIPSYLFSKSTAQSITIPDTVKTIEKSAFRDCNNLERVIIPDSVTTIYGDTLFYKCINLKEVYIPGNAKIWTDYYAESGSPTGGPSDMNMHMFSRSGIKTVYSSKGSDAEAVVQLGYADSISFVEAEMNPYI